MLVEHDCSKLPMAVRPHRHYLEPSSSSYCYCWWLASASFVVDAVVVGDLSASKRVAVDDAVAVVDS